MREEKRNRESDTVQKQTRKLIKREYDYVKEIARKFRETQTWTYTYREGESGWESERGNEIINGVSRRKSLEYWKLARTLNMPKHPD